jgi:hypothetical protein
MYVMKMNFKEVIGLNVPLHLTKEHREDLKEVFREFFSTFDLDDIRSLLWFLTSKVICLDDEAGEFEDFSRETVLLYYNEMNLLFEALFVFVENLNKDVSK